MSYNTKVRTLQGGDALEVDSAGTVMIQSGGSIQIASGGVFDNAGIESIASGGSIRVASGGVLNVASGGSIVATQGVHIGTITIGGTIGRWAFGTATLTSGTALVYTGLGAIRSANAFAITVGNNGTGAGTATSFQFDFSRAGNGTFYAFGLTGTSAFTGAGTFAWTAFGV